MFRIRLIVMLVFVAGCVWGCKEEVKPRWQTVRVSPLYELDLPTYLEVRNDMHETAKLQYYDLATDFYVICLDESKDNVKAIKPDIRLDDYYKMVEDTVMSRAIAKRFLQGTKRKQAEVTTKEGDYEVEKELEGLPYHLLYRITVYETKKNYFQLVMYTPYKDSCAILDKMDSISRSFRLLDNGDKT